VAFTIAETDLFPEGIVFDPANHVFYMGSMGRRKIVRITEAGKVSDFVKSDAYHLLPLGGIKVDPADHGLWAASDNDFDSELLHFNAHGKLLDRFSPPGGSPHVLNDLVLQGSNNVYLTDTLAHHVYRFDRKTHSFTPLALIRPLFYPNGITLAADGNLLYVADDMGVIQVDLRNNSSHQVSPGDHSTMAGIDGLYWYKGDLLGLEYGTGSFRVVRWRLSPDGLRATHTEVLEYRTPLVSFTTTGAIKGQELYFMANTGVGNMKDYKPIDPAKLEPLHIAVVSLTP
jgi:DNA-binding beta-propeller fold protein YncE